MAVRSKKESKIMYILDFLFSEEGACIRRVTRVTVAQ